MREKLSHGEAVVVSTNSVSDGAPFEGKVIGIDKKTETVCVNCRSGEVSFDEVIVSFSNVRRQLER